MTIRGYPKSARLPADGNSDEPFSDVASLQRTPCCTILARIRDGVFTVGAGKRGVSLKRAAGLIATLVELPVAVQFGRTPFGSDKLISGICHPQCEHPPEKGAAPGLPP